MRRLTALVVVTGLLAAACSSDSDSSSESAITETTTTEASAPDVDEVPADTPAPTVTATQPDSTTTAPGPPPQLRIATYNAGLAEGFVPFTTQRQTLVAQAVADLEADIVFLQEVWTPEAVAELSGATSAAFPEAVFPEPIPDTDVGEPACELGELADLEACIAQNCSDAGPDELVECVLTNCAAQYANLCEECQSCIAANVGNTVEEAVSNCTTASSAFAYNGSLGIGLLSKAVITDTDVLVLDSSLNRRAVLHAVVETDGFGRVNVFGTHLSAVFSDIPYPGDGTWEEEQAAQIDTVLTYIDERADPTDPVVLLGDFNTGPAGALYQAEVAANYELLPAAGFTNTYTEQDDARCTFCDDNLLVGDGDESVVIDHVLTRQLAASAGAQRILDQPLTVDSEDVEVTTALSDHYGVMLTLTASP